MSVLAPSMAEDTRFLSWYRRGERLSSTPNAAAATLRWAMEFDLGPVLPAIQARTLIVQRTGSAMFRLEAARAAAKIIPDARCAELPGADALPYVGDTDTVMDVIQEFLTGTQARPDFDRSLATMLFTDIVGSTQKADELGDRRWKYLLEDHHGRIRRLLDRYRGTEVDTAGDGFFATFDGPARAIRCACAAREAVREIGVEIRAGLHTGEVERRGTAATGLAVHVGARVAGLARASEVLIDFKTWYRTATLARSPWRKHENAVLAAEAETSLERRLSQVIMRGGLGPPPRPVKVKAGTTIMAEGDAADDLVLLLDGVVRVEVNGAEVARLGPGAILGERASLEQGRRTATIRAVTDCRIVTYLAADLPEQDLQELAAGHDREGPRQ